MKNRHRISKSPIPVFCTVAADTPERKPWLPLAEPDAPKTSGTHSGIGHNQRRKYLLPKEVELLMTTARKTSRYGFRDSTMILIAYRHGLRASELVGLEWHQIELDAGRLHVRRAKSGTPAVHPIRGDEIRALRRLKRESPQSAFVFVTERGGPMSPVGFHHLISRLGIAAGMPFPIHPHMLRHACGFKLANDGHDTRALQHWLGHKNISNTTIYTQMATDRFKDFWR